MGRHDENAHYLHTPKQIKFKQPKPINQKLLKIMPRSQRLGALNRRG